MSKRLAVDIGGTFVDAASFDADEGDISIKKAATTPDDPVRGVLNSVDELHPALDDVDSFTHGTTLGINAFLEREGAKTGIITNEGFRDVFEIGRTDVPSDEMYNIRYKKPELIVPRERRVGIRGRLGSSGQVVDAIDEQSLRDATEYLVGERDVESIAICFLHSYQNPEHETLAADLVGNVYPEVSVSVSTDITREYREYERTSTTVLDAYIKPIFESYIDALVDGASERGFDGEFFVTRSGGGTMSAKSAKTAPVNTILSGPAGGLIGASHVGRITGRENLIAVDMGGTSLDACVIEDGSPAVVYESALEELSMMIPVYDIRTIGAGGGSIAWVDETLLKVGPTSAGAVPGPICYGNGGTEPTVTDVALLLGFMDPEGFLAGDLELDTAGAERGIRHRLADPLDTTLLSAATGVFDVLLANTVGAIREITVEKGLDPREFTMLAYGGAGPMFIPLLAREIGAPEVLIPQAPSVFSAWGMLVSDVVSDFSQTFIRVLADVPLSEIESAYAALESKASETLDREGYGAGDRRIDRSAEMRYLGQEHTVEVAANGIDSLDDLRARFERQHQNRYGHKMDDPAQVVHLRVRATGVNEKPELHRLESTKGDVDTGTERREAYCFAREALVPFSVYDRDDLAPGINLTGPAIVQEPTTTIVFYSDQHATVDEYGHLLIRSDSDD